MGSRQGGQLLGYVSPVLQPVAVPRRLEVVPGAQPNADLVRADCITDSL